LSLSSAYPNPFNPTTTIRFDIPVGVETHGESSLEVFDLKGRLVKTLADGINHPGQYTVSWDATNSSGVEVSAGIYIVKLNVGNLFKSNKIVLLK
jgi:flagellar hook assembly protein FlgD